MFEYRQTILRRLCALGFLNKNNAPTPEAADSVPRDLECPSDDRISKTIVFFHDESTIQSNDDQTTFWGTRDKNYDVSATEKERRWNNGLRFH